MTSANCGLCNRMVRRTQRFVRCNICHMNIHVRCLSSVSLRDYSSQVIDNYYCQNCIIDIFPFNSIISDNEFCNVLLNFFRDFPLFKNFVFSKQQLEIVNRTVLINNDDIDPDINFYNYFATSCNYYVASDVPRNIISDEVKNFSIMHLNARSIIPKLDDINLLMNQINLDLNVLAVSETWENSRNTHLVNIPGYQKISRYRSDECMGGGVALFINDDVDYQPLPAYKLFILNLYLSV